MTAEFAEPILSVGTPYRLDVRSIAAHSEATVIQGPWGTAVSNQSSTDEFDEDKADIRAALASKAELGEDIAMEDFFDELGL